MNMDAQRNAIKMIVLDGVTGNNVVFDELLHYGCIRGTDLRCVITE